MNNKNLDSTINVLGFFLAGSLLGAATAALLAPYRGSELRGSITVNYNNALEQTKQELNKMNESLQEIRLASEGKMKGKVGELCERMQSRINNLIEDFDRMTNRGVTGILIEDEIL